MNHWFITGAWGNHHTTGPVEGGRSSLVVGGDRSRVKETTMLNDELHVRRCHDQVADRMSVRRCCAAFLLFFRRVPRAASTGREKYGRHGFRSLQR